MTEVKQHGRRAKSRGTRIGTRTMVICCAVYVALAALELWLLRVSSFIDGPGQSSDESDMMPPLPADVGEVGAGDDGEFCRGIPELATERSTVFMSRQQGVRS